MQVLLEHQTLVFAGDRRLIAGSCFYLPLARNSMQNLGVMREVIQLSIDEVTPEPSEVLENQGMTGRALPARITALLDSALEIFRKLAEPRGILQDWPLSQFEAVYDGDGMNAPEGPVPLIIPKSDRLAIFAATMGNSLISKSRELFAQGGAALGFMLDAVNSSGAERMGKAMCQSFIRLLPEDLRNSRKLAGQYYSPGHCGWHISGQEKLFEALHPEEIGVSLNPNWAMQPIKSISGFLVVGDLSIHRFKPAFKFCKDCKEHKCVERLKILEREA
jgi:hypothetical protein